VNNNPDKAAGGQNASDGDAPESPGLPLNDEMLRNVPPEIQREIIQSRTLLLGAGLEPNPLAEKVTGEHITKILDNTAEESGRRAKDKTQSRIFKFAAAVLAAGLFVFLTVFLKPDRDLYVEIIQLLAIFAGGFGAGYGAKAYREKSGE